jgi:hypothetical protein
MDDKNRRPLSSVVATFALPPLPPRQDEFEKFTLKQINRRTHHQGEAVDQPWGPQFQAWH